MAKVKKIAFIASECQPFFTSGGLGEVIGSLPKRIVSLSNKEYKTIVILPKYTNISKDYADKLDFVDSFNIKLSWRNQYCGVYRCNLKGVKYYFIDNEYYFKRDKFYGYFDDAERFAFFCKAAIELMLRLKEVPDIIHAHDWQAGLVPIYLRTLYYNQPEFKKVKRIFTIHNIEYQGLFANYGNMMEDVFGIDRNDTYLLEYHNNLNIMKGAMESSNLVTTVSPSYANEIRLREYAHGLEEEVSRIGLEHKLLGILNGIDVDFYNPKTDKLIYKKFDENTLENKEYNKKKLQTEVGLANNNVPLIGMVTRLVAHKGLEILKSAVNELMKLDLQLVILGTGDAQYEEFFKGVEERFPNKVKVILDFNGKLARRIYAGTDLFLMPSASEPCGLSQMISSRYGSIPMVRSTGGLKDSIHDFKENNGNGYVFEGFEAHSLFEMVERACNDYYKADWHDKVVKVMKVDFSWDKSALLYLDMYKNILN